MSPDALAVLEAEFKLIDEENKVHAADAKTLSNGKVPHGHLIGLTFYAM
jgi:hypothetical protein